jgi:hypothetical protein
MSTVHADFQIAFGAGGAQAHLSAEIDSRTDGYNQGRTSFKPGDVVYFLVYKSANVTYDNPIASAGGITSHGSTSISQTDDLAFPNVRTATIGKPATGITASQWLGNALGALTLVDEMTVQAEAQGVAVARVTTAAPADLWSLTSPASINGLTDYSVLIYIQGHLTGETA